MVLLPESLKLQTYPATLGLAMQLLQTMEPLRIQSSTQLRLGLTLDRSILTRKYRLDGVRFRLSGMMVSGTLISMTSKHCELVS